MIHKDDFISLIEEHKGLINKITFLYAYDKEDRKDLQQEIVGQAWSSIGSFRGKAKFSTWLYRVALNTAISTLKKSKKQTDVKNRMEGQHQTSDSTETELLETILAVLNPIEKSLVLLLVEGYSQSEVAEILGITNGNARTKIHRIRKKLESHGIKELASK